MRSKRSQLRLLTILCAAANICTYHFAHSRQYNQQLSCDEYLCRSKVVEAHHALYSSSRAAHPRFPGNSVLSFLGTAFTKDEYQLLQFYDDFSRCIGLGIRLVALGTHNTKTQELIGLNCAGTEDSIHFDMNVINLTPSKK